MIAPGLRRLLVGLFLGMGILVGGCNVFNGLGPEPNTVEELLTEARAALTAGETKEAVRLLERALEKDSSDVRVRVELGNALFSHRGLDLFALREAAAHLAADSDSAGSGGTSTVSFRGSRACTGGSEPGTSAGRYSSISMGATSVERLVKHRTLIERVRALTVEGVFNRRSVALANSDVDVRRKAYLVGAATKLMQGAVNVRDALAETEATLYHDRRPDPDGAYVACAPDKPALGAAHEAVCTLASGVDRATEWLRVRAQLSGSTRTMTLVQWLRRIDSAARAGVGCS